MSHIFTRLRPVRDVLKGLEEGVNSAVTVGERAEAEDLPGFDWEDVQQTTEEFYGAAFVIAQSFLRGEFRTLLRESTILLKSDEQNYWRLFSPQISNTGISRLELVIALANGYKHSEEWGYEWKTVTANSEPTITTLRQVNLTHSNYFLCNEGVNILTDDKYQDFFQTLFSDLVNWRAELVKKDGGTFPTWPYTW